MPAAATDKLRKSYSFLTKALSSNISSVDTTIPLNNTTNVPTDTAVDFIIDRVDTNGTRTPTTRELCSGVVSGSNIINVTRGMHGTTAQSHTSGAVVEFIVSGMAHNDMVDHLLTDHSQLGRHKSLTDTNGNTWIGQTATASAVNYPNLTNSATGNTVVYGAAGSDSNIDLTLTPKGTGQTRRTGRWDPWVTGLTAPSTVTYNGNRSYDVVVNSTDLTGFLSAGMRLRTTRTVAAPNQCTSLNGTTQYWVKTSPSAMTFTDDFVVSAWVKLSSYSSTADQVIASRYNGTSGWELFVSQNTGTVVLRGYNAGAANLSQVQSYQSIPLGKWIHITAQLDMSAFTATTTTSYVMFDGVDVPAVVARTGTNPTALVQAGNLEIGTSNTTRFFPGKIAQVAIYNAKVTQATIRGSISQGLTGSETSLISAYSFSNSTNDLSANANNLSAGAGSPTATTADSPFGGQADGTISTTLDYAIIQKVSFSTNTTLTVQVPEGCTIPTTGGVSALAYSTEKAPYGMPVQRGKWRVQSLQISSTNTGSVASATISNVASFQLSAPVGDGILAYEATYQQTPASGNNASFSVNLSTSSSAFTNIELTTNVANAAGAAQSTYGLTLFRSTDVSNTSATPYYLLIRNDLLVNGTQAICATGVSPSSKIYWEPAHL